jgi:hypothetical protein
VSDAEVQRLLDTFTEVLQRIAAEGDQQIARILNDVMVEGRR